MRRQIHLFSLTLVVSSVIVSAVAYFSDGHTILRANLVAAYIAAVAFFLTRRR